MKNCARFGEQVEEYLKGRCAPDMGRWMAEHAAACSRCRQEIAAARAMRVTLRAAVEQARAGVPGGTEEFLSAIHRRIDAREARRREAPSRVRSFRLVPPGLRQPESRRQSLSLAGVAVVFAVFLLIRWQGNEFSGPSGGSFSFSVPEGRTRIAQALRRLANGAGIRNAWLPGRKRPVCRRESRLNPASPAEPVASMKGRSRSFPTDRPVVYGRGAGRAEYPFIWSKSIMPGEARGTHPPQGGADLPVGAPTPPAPRHHRGPHSAGLRRSATDDLAYLNVDPLAAAPWAPLARRDTGALEQWVRQNVRARDDFVQIPFPRVATASEAQNVAAVEQYKREAAIVDARLFQKVTLQDKAVAFVDFCRDLEKQSGVRIEAGRMVADEKVTVLMKERPLRELMRAVSHLFGFTWLRSGKEGEYRYELVQDLRSQLLEEELRNRDLNEALLAMDRQMQALRPYLNMTPEQLQAKAEAATSPAEKKRLQLLAGKGWGPFQMYFRLSPEEITALRSGQDLRYSSQPGPGQRPLPEDLRLGTLDGFSDYRYWEKGASHGFGPVRFVPDGATQYEPKAMPEAAALTTLHVSRSELGQVALDGDGGFSIKGGMVSGGDVIATGMSPSVASPANGRANAALARDPALQPVVSWRPEPSCRCGVDYPPAYPWSTGREDAAAERQKRAEQVAMAERAPLPVSTADVLAAIHRATGIDILSDAYTRLFPTDAVSVEKQRLFDALNGTADAMRYRWRKESGILQFRSASYFADKLKEVPNRLLDRWAASIREHGRLSLEDVIEIAQLSDAQLDSDLIAEGAVRCHGIKGWNLARTPNLRRHLRFLALFDPEQLRLAQNPEGLSFRGMNNAQKQQFLAIAFGDSESSLTPESLPAARLRMDLTMPGEFEWVPREEQYDFTTEQRIRAGTRDLALAAARQVDAAVNPTDILPTTARLWIEYSLGPAAGGRRRFVLVQPNGVRTGFRGPGARGPG